MLSCIDAIGSGKFWTILDPEELRQHAAPAPSSAAADASSDSDSDECCTDGGDSKADNGSIADAAADT